MADNFAVGSSAAGSFAVGNRAVVVVGSFAAGNWAVVEVAVGAASWIVAEVAKPAGADRRLGSLVGFGPVRGSPEKESGLVFGGQVKPCLSISSATC